MQKRCSAQALRAVMAVLSCGLIAVAALADQSQTVRVVVDGKALPPSATQVVDNKAYIALRPLAQVLGADITSDSHANTVTVTTLLRQVVFRIDDRAALVNGQRILLDAPARKLESRVLIPLRSLGSAFGAAVSYRQQDHTVVVATNPNSVPYTRTGTAAPVAATKTISGTVTTVQTDAATPTVQLAADDGNYTISVPSGTRIELRDVHGAVTAKGYLSQVRPGDALIVTLDGSGHLIAIADIFASVIGTIAAVAGPSLVLTNGKVIAADPSVATVTLDGHPADFNALKAGDKVSVRSDPKTGRVRDVVALTPGGYAVSGGASPLGSGQSGSGAVQIRSVRENADHAFRAGQDLHVSAEGTSGAQAFFDLSNVIVGNAMRETYPGHYEGDYTIAVGTNLSDAPLIVRFAKNGETAVAEAPDAIDIVTTPPVVRETAPEANQQINAARPNIFAAFTTVNDKGMDPNSLRMLVNGQDVTATATRTPTFISYYPGARFNTGTVQVEVRGTDIAGNTLQYRWTFVVARADEGP